MKRYLFITIGKCCREGYVEQIKSFDNYQEAKAYTKEQERIGDVDEIRHLIDLKKEETIWTSLSILRDEEWDKDD